METIASLINIVRIPSTNKDEWWEKGYTKSGSSILRIWNHRIGRVTWKFFLNKREWMLVRNKFKESSIIYHTTLKGEENFWLEVSQPNMLIYKIIRFIIKIQ